MSSWRSVWTYLVVSHAVAGGVGVAAGMAYVTKLDPTTQTVLHGLERRPLLDAANVAFQFGSPEHSRATLESFLRLPVANGLDWGDTMLAELRLAVLDGELEPGGVRSRHLDAARSACQRFNGADCAPEQLRALASKLAEKRR